MESNTLKKIIPIEQLWINLDNFENRLYEISSSKDSYLNDISQYLIKAGGKRFRPICTLLAGELGNGNNEKIIDAAVAVELIHLGSLYHDDVIDEAETRRSVQSANVKWNATLSILAGDYLLARSSELAAETLGLESVKLLASTYAELVEGQTKEVQYQYDTDHNTDDYMKVIEGKTASLIRTSAKLGAMAAECDEKTTQAISKWAWHSGFIFQITDDILDLSSDTETLGKEGIVARLGGDEFAIVSPVFKDKSEAAGFARRLLTRINDRFEFGDRLSGEIHAGAWFDIGTPERLERLREMLGAER